GGFVQAAVQAKLSTRPAGVHVGVLRRRDRTLDPDVPVRIIEWRLAALDECDLLDAVELHRLLDLALERKTLIVLRFRESNGSEPGWARVVALADDEVRHLLRPRVDHDVRELAKFTVAAADRGPEVEAHRTRMNHATPATSCETDELRISAGLGSSTPRSATRPSGSTPRARPS